MASRRFFAYDPYDDYYASPYHYSYPYHQYYQQPTPSRAAGGFFPAAAPEPLTVAPRPRAESSSRPPVSIPVHFVGSDPEPQRVTAAAAAPRKPAPSAEAAAVQVQAVARGFLARRSVRAVREVEREAAEVGSQIAREAAALRGDARGRVAVGEALMRMLLRLDAVRGAREYRRKVTKRVLALQDAVDALEAATPAPEAEAEGNESREVAGESAAASELPDVSEPSGGIEAETVAETAAAEMEVDADGEPGVGDGTAQECMDAEGEWEMVTEEPEPVAEQPAAYSEAPRPQEPAGAEIRTAEEGAAAAGDGGLDARKVRRGRGATTTASATAAIEEKYLTEH